MPAARPAGRGLPAARSLAVHALALVVPGKSRMFAGRPDAEAGRQLARACSGQSATQSTDSALGIVVSGPLFALLAQQSLLTNLLALPSPTTSRLLYRLYTLFLSPNNNNGRWEILLFCSKLSLPSRLTNLSYI